MAYKRKRTASRNYSRKRRRIFRRPLRVPRGVRAGKTHMFKRVCELEPISITNTNSTGSLFNQPILWSHSFRFNQLPNFSEFTALFDQYRINKLKILIVPNITGLDGVNMPYGGEYTQPDTDTVVRNVVWPKGLFNIHSVIDYDDTNMTNYTIAQLMQYSTYKMTRGNRMHTRYWTPAISTGVYDGGVNAAPGGHEFRKWIDLSETDVPHFGVKAMIDPGPVWMPGVPANGMLPANYNVLELQARVYLTAYFECKGVR